MTDYSFVMSAALVASAEIVTVAGYSACPHFQKTANIVAALEHLVGENKLKARIVEHDTQTAFADWARTKIPTLDSRGRQVNEMTSPLCYSGETYIGAAEEAINYFRAAYLGRSRSFVNSVVNPDMNNAGQQSYDYDLIVIGGGSGGLACAKQASTLGAKVLMCDFVKPSPLGTKWGLGGTCVNVGCIPKKLMHTAALVRETMEDAAVYGWETKEGKGAKHDWQKMVSNVQNHIKSLNFKYRVELREKDVVYKKCLASFTSDPHKIELKNAKGDVEFATGRRVVVAVGGRPTPIRCPGGELALSSDDLFSMKSSPGKTLVVGASYIALECAGFLAGLGFDVTVMVRSILLRGFDRDCVERIHRDMVAKGVKFLHGVVPESIEQVTGSSEKSVSWTPSGSKDAPKDLLAGKGKDSFDTVFGAIGRSADTHLLNLDKVGVNVNGRNGKILCKSNEQTNVPHIYAIGDVMEGCPELTPVAIQAGKLLSKRLFEKGFEKPMDYHHIATTVFTPLEYGCIGYSEEDAIAKNGFENVEVYHRVFVPLEWSMPHHRPDNLCYAKLICDKLDDMRIIGLHYCGPNAGEVTQGWSLAMKCGATYDDFWNTVGIHPTTAEELTILSVTKASGESAEGGSC